MIEIRQGDCLELIKELPDESVNCVVTSPPYWGLRDYGHPGAWGLEPTVWEHIERVTALFAEIWRVLRKDGTVWLNYGDCFSNKQLVGLPWRIAFALQDAGWYLRSDIIWAKPNPMPESVRDRPTRAHEYIFMLTKSARYWYDADAIRTPLTEVSIARLSQPNYENQNGSTRANGGTGYVRGALVQGKTNGTMEAVCKKPDKQRGHSRKHAGFNDRWDAMTKDEQMANGANARDVWEIATKPFREAHFATFPPEIPRRCILAGCPVGGTVLDPFAGSGTTLAVADELGRIGLGFEVNPEYIEIANRRFQTVTPSMFCE